MKLSILWAVAVSLCLCHKASSEFPAGIQRCQAGDVKCIVKVANDILRNHPSSTAKIGLGNLDPVHLKELIVAKTDGDQPLSLDLKFVDLEIHGLSKTVVNRLEGFERDPSTSKFELYFTIPDLILRGKYETKGKILLLPISGKGNAEIRLKNLKSGIKIKAAATKKNGKTSLTIKQIKVQNEPELVRVKLDNLFNGNKELGDELNSVLNMNWRDVWDEMLVGTNEAYAGIVKGLIDQVLAKITYDEFYSN